MAQIDLVGAAESQILRRVVALSGNTEEYAQDFITSAVRTSPALRNLVCEDIALSLRNSLSSKTGRRSVKIHEQLTIVEQNLLEQSFPEFQLTFSSTQGAGFHPFARAHRKLEYYFLYDKLCPDGLDCPGDRFLVKDVGGSVSWHIGNNSRKTHVCSPILDINDSSRYTRYRELTSRVLPKKGTFLSEIDKPGNNVVCHAKSQHCSVRANSLLFIHSAYDMTATDIAASMSKADATTGYGTIIFHPDVLIQSSGLIPKLGCRYEKFRRSGIKYIRFSFVSDGQLSYTHRWDTYTTITTKFLIQYKDKSYSINLFDNRNNVYFFEILKVMAPYVPPSVATRQFVSEEDLLILYTYDYSMSYKRTTISGQGVLKPVRLIVPRKLYERIFAYGLTLADGKFLLKNLMTAAIAFNSREVINGVSVTNELRMDVKDLTILVSSIYHLLYIRQYELSKLMHELQNDEKIARNFGWFQRFKRLLFETQPYTLDYEGKHVLDNINVDANDKDDVDKQYRLSWFTRLIDAVSLNNVPCRLFPIYCSHMIITMEEELTSVVGDSFINLNFVEDRDSMYMDLARQAYDRSFKEVGDEVLNITPEVSQCMIPLKTLKTEGHGQCGYHALRLCGATDLSPDEIRRELLESSSLARHSERDSLVKRLTASFSSDEGWADDSILGLFAHVHGLTICIHSDVGCIRYSFGKKIYHIHHSDNHFSAMRPTLPDDAFVKIIGQSDDDIDWTIEAADVVELEEKLFRHPRRVVDQAIDTVQTIKIPSSSGVICRSYYKMSELIERYNIPSGVTVLDVCGGPGGFARCLLDHGCTVYGVTKDDHIAYDPSLMECDRFSVLNGPESPGGDITNIINFSSIQSYLSTEFPEGIDYVFCDGATSDTNDFQANFDLVRTEIHLASLVVARGGHIFVKVVKPYHGLFASLIQYLSSVCDVELVRLFTSRITSGESFLHLQNFTPEMLDEVVITPGYVSSAVFSVLDEFKRDHMTAIANANDVAGHLMKDRKLDLSKSFRDDDKSELFVQVLNRRLKGGAVSDAIEATEVNVRHTRRITFCPRSVVSRVNRFFDKIDDHIFGDDVTPQLGYVPFNESQSIAPEAITPSISCFLPITESTHIDADGDAMVDDYAEVGGEVAEIQNPSQYESELAMTEYLSYLDACYKAELGCHRTVYNNIMASPFFIAGCKADSASALIIQLVHGPKGNYGLLKRGRVFVKPATCCEKYNKVYTEDGFKPYEESKYYDWSLISDYTEFCLDDETHTILSALGTRSYDSDKIKLIQAAPGTGKTTYIVNHVDVDAGDVVVLSTVNGKEEFKNRLREAGRKNGKFYDNALLKSNVRTMQSLLMNHSVVARTLYVDEALMHHSGAVYFAAVITRAATVICLGDIHQIPFVNRVPNITLHYADTVSKSTIIDRLSISYRCPVDVVCRIGPKYDHGSEKLLSANLETVESLPNTSTCSIVNITGVNDPRIKSFAPTHYLTFTVADKRSVMKEYGISNVNTVHEFQGNQSERIAVIRTDPNPQSELFHREPYALVALTRHTKRMTYFTRYESDALSKMIKIIINRADIRQRRMKLVGGSELDDDHPIIRVERVDPVNITPYSTLDIVNTEFRNSNRFRVHVGRSKSPYARLNFVTSSMNLMTIKKALLLAMNRALSNGHDKVAVQIDNLHRFDLATISRFVYPLIRAGLQVRFHSHQFIDNIHPNVFELFNRNALVPNYESREYVEILGTADVGGREKFVIVDDPPTGSNRIGKYAYQKRDRFFFIFRELNSGEIKFITPEFVDNLQVAFRSIRRPYVVPTVAIDNEFIDLSAYLRYDDTGIPEVDIPQFQAILNDVFPKASFINTDFDLWMMHNYSFEIQLPSMVLDLTAAVYKHNEYDCLRPNLHSVAPIIRQHTSREAVLAAKKRNFDSPELTGTVDYYVVAASMLDCISSTLNRKSFELIDITPDDVWSWLKKQDTHVVDHIVPDVPLHDDALNEYNFEIKKHPKPDLTRDSHEQYKALQTIVSHPKHVNAIYCVIFREIKRRLMMSLPVNIKLLTDSSVADFMAIANNDCDMHTPGEYTEIDISKYDKSELELMLEFECLYMAHFGVPRWLITLWRNAHTLTVLSDRRTGMRANVFIQRKSGDASTLLGNCLYLLGSLLYYMRLNNIQWTWLWVLGDDSLIKGGDIASKFNMQQFSLLFNLEIKIFSYQNPYFCSKFLVKNSKGSYVLVPDPIKLLIKLARSDLKNFHHMEEYRISFADNVSELSDPVVCQNLSIAVSERYSIFADYASSFSDLYYLSFRKNFSKLYYSLPGDKLDSSKKFSKD